MSINNDRSKRDYQDRGIVLAEMADLVQRLDAAGETLAAAFVSQAIDALEDSHEANLDG